MESEFVWGHSRRFGPPPWPTEPSQSSTCDADDVSLELDDASCTTICF